MKTNTMRTLEVAVLGCGRMGRLRAHAAQRLGARVRAVFDVDAERAELLAQSLPGCRAAALTEATDWAGYDAVFVCTPPAERAGALDAITQRVATFIEKPVSVSAEAAWPMVQAARRHGVITAVGYMNRHRKAIVRLHAELQERPARDTVLGASAHWVNGIYAVPWWTRHDASGGSLNEQVTHAIDLFRHLLGEPEQVHTQASLHPEHPGLIGSAVVSLSWAGGVLATLFYSCRSTAKAIGLRVFTASGEQVLHDWDFHEAGEVPVAPEDRNRIFDVETQGFLQAVAGGGTDGIRCDVADAWRTQRVLDAAGRSWTEGRPCPIDTTVPAT